MCFIGTWIKILTKDEFEEKYARRSGLSVEELYKMRLRAKECNYEYKDCKEEHIL